MTSAKSIIWARFDGEWYHLGSVRPWEKKAAHNSNTCAQHCILLHSLWQNTGVINGSWLHTVRIGGSVDHMGVFILLFIMGVISWIRTSVANLLFNANGTFPWQVLGVGSLLIRVNGLGVLWEVVRSRVMIGVKPIREVVSAKRAYSGVWRFSARADVYVV